jgi:hypothetical protein
MTIQEDIEIGKNYAAQGLKAEDIAFMSKPPKQAKQAKQPKSKSKPSEASAAKPSESQQPTPPSDSDLLTKKTAYDKARSAWAHGTLSTQELDTFHATYMRARAVYSSQQSLYGGRLPPENPLPKLNRKLEDALLDRDECQEKLRTARVEESKLKQEKASSDVKIAAISSLALDILHDINDSRSIPALSAKAALAEDLVKTLETQLRVARRET